LNDIQHQECQNPGFEQEPPQILQLTETIIYICSYLKRNEADIYSNQKEQQSLISFINRF